MLSKPFTEIDYTDMDDLKKLLYCVVLVNNPVLFTYEEFLQIADNEKQLSAMVREMEKANAVIGQFTMRPPDSVNMRSGEAQYIKELIGILIMAGLDASYVMNEMEISDMPLFIEAYDRKRREDMEASRLWTFFTMLPHVDTSKIRSAKDIFLFPWEEKEEQEKAQQAIQSCKDFADRFFRGEYNPLKPS